MSPKYEAIFNEYFTYWLHYLSVPTLGLFFLFIAFGYHLQYKAREAKRKEYNAVFNR